MDIHRLQDADAEAVAKAHAADVGLQAQYGVEYIKYWFNEGAGKVFCLCTAPDAEAARHVHQMAHGLVAEQIIEVEPQLAEAFLGGGAIAATGDVRVPGSDELDTAIRTVLFTDIVESTSLTQIVGDRVAMEIIGMHDTVVRNAISVNSGREIKHTGDGIMISFLTADRAVRAAARIQSDLAANAFERGGIRLQVRIGAAAGEPVERHNDLFGSTVQLAARLTAAAQPQEILVSESVRDLCEDVALPFIDRGGFTLKGFDQPQRAVSVDWPRLKA